eukprot:1379184-Amphidinium_carterae.1
MQQTSKYGRCLSGRKEGVTRVSPSRHSFQLLVIYPRKTICSSVAWPFDTPGQQDLLPDSWRSCGFLPVLTCETEDMPVCCPGQATHGPAGTGRSPRSNTARTADCCLRSSFFIQCATNLLHHVTRRAKQNLQAGRVYAHAHTAHLLLSHNVLPESLYTQERPDMVEIMKRYCPCRCCSTNAASLTIDNATSGLAIFKASLGSMWQRGKDKTNS